MPSANQGLPHSLYMEAIKQARHLFGKCHLYQASLTDQDKEQLKADIKRFIRIAIKETTSKDLFENSLILDVLQSALKLRACEDSDVIPLARAFQALEKYFLLLVEQPWKPEFKEIKMYGGYYTTRVRSVLPNSESIFEHAGYQIYPDQWVMKYRGSVNKSFLLSLAFECRLSQVVCEMIAEHYEKVKSLSMSLSDAINNILHDGHTRDHTVRKLSLLNQGNGTLVDRAPAAQGFPPPAIPKREPIREPIVHPLNMGYAGKNLYPDLPRQRPNPSLEARVAFPAKPSSHTSDFYSCQRVRPPLTPSGVVPAETFVYPDEALHDLPQGTAEDHIAESVKLLNLQRQPRSNHSSVIPPSPQSDPLTPSFSNANKASNPAAWMTQSRFKCPSFYDEGIKLDTSAAKAYQHTVKLGSQNGQLQQQQHSQSHAFVLSTQQPQYEQGYRAIGQENTIYPSLGPGYSSQPMIYQPSITVADGAAPGGQQLPAFPKPNSNPPPIPSRELKPKLFRTDDSTSYRQMFLSAPTYVTSESSEMTLGPSEVITSRPLVSAPGYTSCSQTFNTQPILRREHQPVVKASSTNAGGDSPSMPQQLNLVRGARSMDMTRTPWECPDCKVLNRPSNGQCFICSYSRLAGTGWGPHLLSGTAKSCVSCTYANSPDKTHCEMCGSKLHDRLSAV